MSRKIITITVRDAPIVHFDSPEDLKHFVSMFPKDGEKKDGEWLALMNPKPIKIKRKGRKKSP